MGGIFSNQGQGANGQPSFLQNLVQGAAKGAGTAAGNGMQKQPGGGGGGLPAAPAATPVDPRFFQPSAQMPQRPGGGAGMPASAFYGG